MKIYALRYPKVAACIQTITNGYDPADFAGLSRQRAADGTFLVVHTGSLGASRYGYFGRRVLCRPGRVARQAADRRRTGAPDR